MTNQKSVIDTLVNNLPFELHGWDPNVGKYSSLGPGTNHKDRIDQYIKTGNKNYIAKNDLDLAAFFHDNAYSKFDNATDRRESDLELIKQSKRIANNNSYGGYQRALAALTYKFFEKKVQQGLGLSRTNANKLKETYYNPSTGYSSISDLVRKTSLPYIDIKRWLETQETYQKHKKINLKHHTRRVMSRGVNHQWQVDLVEMIPFAKVNNGFKYILTCIDIFSKYAIARPLKNKTAQAVTEAFKDILNQGRKPLLIQSDHGSEFISKKTQQLFNSQGIRWFETYNLTKAQTVERFNKTLKDKLYMYFSANNTKRWVHVLEKFVTNYNNSYHSSIKMTPTEASKLKNAIKVGDNLYDDVREQTDTPAFEVGDRVRISKHKGKFRRGYLANFTSEVFVIDKILDTYPTTYKLKDLQNEDIIGSFYKEELSIVRE